MKSADLFGKENVKVVEVDIPKIAEYEILVKVKAASICGSDVRMIKNGYKNVDEDHPLTLGHEFAGVIEEIGEQINGYKKGMRVAVAPNWGCGVCDACVSGNTHLCDEYQAFGINKPGGFAEYVVIPKAAIEQGNIAVLSDNISFEEGSLAEPLSCVLNGQEIVDIKLGDSVLIIGAGPIGIMHAMLAEVWGAGKVILNDLSEERLDAAKVIIPSLTIVKDNLEETIKKITDGKGVDVCIVAAPAPSAQEASLNYLKMNGKVLFFGGLPKEREIVNLNSNLIHYKQIRIFGSARANISQYRTCLKLIEHGKIPIRKLVTNHFSIDDFKKGAEAAARAEGLKNIITFDS